MSTAQKASTLKKPEGKNIIMNPLLLKSEKWDTSALETALGATLGLKRVDDEERSADPVEAALKPLVLEVPGKPYLVSFVSVPYPMPVPPEDLLNAAENNYFWPEAGEVIQTHRAHTLLVVSMHKDRGDGAAGADGAADADGAASEAAGTAAEAAGATAEATSEDEERFTHEECLSVGELFAKVAFLCCQQPEVLGILVNNVFISGEQYVGMVEDQIQEGMFPLDGLMWTGAVANEEGVLFYTVGLADLGCHELEMQVPIEQAEEAMGFFRNLAYWSVVLEPGVIKEGDTVGYTEQQQCTLHFQEGQALPGTEVVRIEFEPEVRH